jgi:uncharacterized protein (TIGR02268 family)
VEVFRHRRTVEDYQQEVQEKEARIRQLQTELVRTQAEGSGLGITGLIASELLKVDALNVQGVLAKNLKSTITMPSANALPTPTVSSYRSTTARGEKGGDVMRVAVAMAMDNPGTAPWTARDAALLVGKGQDVKEAKVWQLAPIPPGGSGLVNELRAAGERYGKLMGRNAARAFAMLAMAAIGNTAPGLAAKVPKFPVEGATEGVIRCVKNGRYVY